MHGSQTELPDNGADGIPTTTEAAIQSQVFLTNAYLPLSVAGFLISLPSWTS